MREVCDIVTFDVVNSLMGRSRRKTIQDVSSDVVPMLTPGESLYFDANTHGTL